MVKCLGSWKAPVSKVGSSLLVALKLRAARILTRFIAMLEELSLSESILRLKVGVVREWGADRSCSSGPKNSVVPVSVGDKDDNTEPTRKGPTRNGANPQ